MSFSHCRCVGDIFQLLPVDGWRLSVTAGVWVTSCCYCRCMDDVLQLLPVWVTSFSHCRCVWRLSVTAGLCVMSCSYRGCGGDVLYLLPGWRGWGVTFCIYCRCVWRYCRWSLSTVGQDAYLAVCGGLREDSADSFLCDESVCSKHKDIGSGYSDLHIHTPCLAFRRPSSRNWLRRWRGTPYLCASVNRNRSCRFHASFSTSLVRRPKFPTRDNEVLNRRENEMKIPRWQLHP